MQIFWNMVCFGFLIDFVNYNCIVNNSLNF